MLFFSNNSSYLLTFLFYIRKKTRNVNKKRSVQRKELENNLLFFSKTKNIRFILSYLLKNLTIKYNL